MFFLKNIQAYAWPGARIDVQRGGCDMAVGSWNLGSRGGRGVECMSADSDEVRERGGCDLPVTAFQASFLSEHLN